MPRVAELMADRATTKVKSDLGEFTITYRPRVVTSEWQRKVGEAELAGGGVALTLFQPIRETVIEWDLTDEHDKPYEFTDEALAAVPLQLLNQVLMTVAASIRPNQSRLVDASTATSSAPSTATRKSRTGSD